MNRTVQIKGYRLIYSGDRTQVIKSIGLEYENLLDRTDPSDPEFNKILRSYGEFLEQYR